MRATREQQNALLSEMYQLLIDMHNLDEVQSALDFLIEECGLLMHTTHALTRILHSQELYEPLLLTILALTEDISTFEDKEEQALHDSNAVARVSDVLQQTVDRLLNTHSITDNTEYLFQVLVKCLTILSNLSQSPLKSDLRHEILKHRVLNTLAPLVQQPERFTSTAGEHPGHAMAHSSPLFGVLETILWFLAHITVEFETRYLAKECEEGLVIGICRFLVQGE
jgi:hypothetical protein